MQTLNEEREATTLTHSLTFLLLSLSHSVLHRSPKQAYHSSLSSKCNNSAEEEDDDEEDCEQHDNSTSENNSSEMENDHKRLPRFPRQSTQGHGHLWGQNLNKCTRDD